MQVVFIKDIPKIARRGDMKNVKEGYFQNYLQPNRLAVVATDAELRKVEEMRKHQMLEKEKIKEQAGEIKKKLEGLKIVLKGKSKGDKLYGSFGEKEISEAIEKQIKVRLGKEHILLSEHIKVVGSYEVPIRLADGVECKLMLEIKGEK